MDNYPATKKSPSLHQRNIMAKDHIYNALSINQHMKYGAIISECYSLE